MNFATPLTTRLNHLVGCLLAIAMLASIGCGSGGSHLPKTVPASGTVTLDGKPVDGAQVVFVPAGDGATGAFGTTNASGHFSLRSYDEKDGAIPGTYKVQVSKTIQKLLDGPKGSLDGGDPVRFEYGVPAKYTGAQTSGLTATIPDAGTSDIKLQLSSK
jgi:hypothetical protein